MIDFCCFPFNICLLHFLDTFRKKFVSKISKDSLCLRMEPEKQNRRPEKNFTVKNGIRKKIEISKLRPENNSETHTIFRNFGKSSFYLYFQFLGGCEVWHSDQCQASLTY